MLQKKTQDGYTLVKEKLDPTKHKQLLNIFKQLDNNGKDDFDKLKDYERACRYEALQNALP